MQTQFRTPDAIQSDAAQMRRYDDPLRPDASDDAPVVTTRRGLSRIALIATETATRFARGGIRHEPMSWMLAPRRMFDGRTPLIACLDLDDCERAIALHRVGEALDEDPLYMVDIGVDIDIDADEDADADGSAGHRRMGRRVDGACDVGLAASVCEVRPVTAPAERLFTAVVHEHGADGFVQAFAARIVPSRAEFCSALDDMYGKAAAGALVREGFDATHPLVAALVSPAIADVLAQVAADPGSPLGAGLDVRIEQRFLA